MSLERERSSRVSNAPLACKSASPLPVVLPTPNRVRLLADKVPAADLPPSILQSYLRRFYGRTSISGELYAARTILTNL